MSRFTVFAGYEPRKSTILVATHKHLCLICHPRRFTVRDEEWSEFNTYLEEHLHHGVSSLLVYSAGAGLSVTQRASSAAVMDEAPGEMQVAILSESRSVRGAATAWGWLSKHLFAFFPPDDIRAALDHVRAEPASEGAIKKLLYEMMLAQDIVDLPSWAGEPNEPAIGAQRGPVGA